MDRRPATAQGPARLVRPVSLGPRRPDPKAREPVTAVLPKRSSACFGESASDRAGSTGPTSRAAAAAPSPRLDRAGPSLAPSELASGLALSGRVVQNRWPSVAERQAGGGAPRM